MRFRETSASDPLMRCRKPMDDIKTGVLDLLQDKLRGNLITVWAVSGIKVA